jgi:hypothetical protein
VAGGFLDVTERDARVEGGGDERVAQGVRTDPVGDAGTTGDAANDATGRVPIESLTACTNEARSFAAFTDGQIDRTGSPRCQRHGDHLGALASDGERAVPALEPEHFDVAANRFGDAQSVQREQADQGVIGGAGQSGGDEHGADFVAVQTGGVRLVVESRATDMDRRRGRDEAFFFGLPVDPVGSVLAK